MEADPTLVRDLLDGRQMAVAESLTCGRLARLFADTECSTDWFRGGVTAWQHETKYNLLGLPEGSPVVTAEAAAAMATGAAHLFDAAVTIATTGAAGPEGMDGVPPGTVFVATSVDGVVETTELQLKGSPGDVCDEAARHALRLLVQALRASTVASVGDGSGPARRREE